MNYMLLQFGSPRQTPPPLLVLVLVLLGALALDVLLLALVLDVVLLDLALDLLVPGPSIFSPFNRRTGGRLCIALLVLVLLGVLALGVVLLALVLDLLVPGLLLPGLLTPLALLLCGKEPKWLADCYVTVLPIVDDEDDAPLDDPLALVALSPVAVALAVALPNCTALGLLNDLVCNSLPRGRSTEITGLRDAV
jgi:hypothetical protein